MHRIHNQVAKVTRSIDWNRYKANFHIIKIDEIRWFPFRFINEIIKVPINVSPKKFQIMNFNAARISEREKNWNYSEKNSNLFTDRVQQLNFSMKTNSAKYCFESIFPWCSSWTFCYCLWRYVIARIDPVRENPFNMSPDFDINIWITRITFDWPWTNRY